MEDETPQQDGAASEHQTNFTDWFNVHGGPLVLIVAVVSAIAAIALGSAYSDELTKGGDSLARIIRDIGLAAAVPPSAVLALWRGSVAQRQADISLRSHLNERYQNGVQLLDNATIMVRIGGIHVLENLALESPKTHLAQTIQILCAFSRNPPGDPVSVDRAAPETHADADLQESHKMDSEEAKEDVVTAVRIAADCLDSCAAAAPDVDLRLELAGVVLNQSVLSGLKLNGAILERAQLVRTSLNQTELNRANLSNSTLVGSMFNSSKLNGANIWKSDLERVLFWNAEVENSNLRETNMRNAFMFGTRLGNANMEQADLRGVHSKGTDFKGANLTHARLEGAFLIDTDFTATNLSGTKFVGESDDTTEFEIISPKFVEYQGTTYVVASGLTQDQLDSAVADPDNPPVLEHVVDAETGEQLVWRGGPVPKPTEGETGKESSESD